MSVAVISAVLPILDRVLAFIPDPEARAKAREELTLKLVEIESSERKAQVDLNKQEAQHKSVFVAGWRPFIGWVGGVSLAWTFLVHPLITWIATVSGYAGPFPELNTSELLTLVMAMLGVGAMRSFDKMQGTSTEVIKPSTKPTYND